MKVAVETSQKPAPSNKWENLKWNKTMDREEERAQEYRQVMETVRTVIRKDVQIHYENLVGNKKIKK